MDYSDWMKLLDDSLKQRPLVYLAIPGSHDSLSYTISPQSSVSPDAEPVIKLLAKFFGPIVRRVMYKWCVTQSADVTQQLELGIRYFDIRLSTKETDLDFYFVHGLYGGSIQGPLTQIKDFLEDHVGEVVVLDLQHFYSFYNHDHKRLVELLEEIFGEMLCPQPADASDVSLDSMLSNGYRVVVIYRNPMAESRSTVWPSRLWPTPWPETMSTDYLITFLNERLAKRPLNTGFVSQCVLTPTKSTVFRHPWSGVFSVCALPASRVVIPWLTEEKSDHWRRVNVAIADFINDNNALFPRTVLSLNDTRLNRVT